MSSSLQRNLPPLPLQRLDGGDRAKVQKLDGPAELAEIPLEMAKAQIGRALHKTITRTDAVLKDFGDPSHVKRVCDGDVPSVLARAFQTPERRREFIRALAENEPGVRCKTVIEIDEEVA